ncbi:hypothetical protein N656DRAFT_285147 [Canariomyces notabilis]|uniref:Uncharacterized protein n=1 Tax=Canariomyces notabilis TaxID=2074819 RepID=A0AAN6QHB4_9PEZI|nr:hypothetical protein N656DRAFT_285147 [Canariomyces arenarius]
MTKVAELKGGAEAASSMSVSVVLYCTTPILLTNNRLCSRKKAGAAVVTQDVTAITLPPACPFAPKRPTTQPLQSTIRPAVKAAKSSQAASSCSQRAQWSQGKPTSPGVRWCRIFHLIL